MPVLMITYQEAAATILDRMRLAASAILELANLDLKPLDPGESPDARRHKIAKLGKELAELTASLDSVISAAADAQRADPTSHPASVETPEAGTN